MKKRNIVGSGIVGAALLASIGFGGTSLAQTGTQSTTPTPVVTTTGSTNGSAAPIAPLGPGGPPAGPDGGPGGGPGARANTQEGAARELQHAYNDFAKYQTDAPSNAPAAAGQLITRGKALYEAALKDYQSSNWSVTSERAKAASSAAKAALHLAKGETNTTTGTVSGLTPPPATSTDSDSDKAARELQHAYDSIGRAQGYSSVSDASFYITAAKNAYTAALGDYNAKRYGQANERAKAAHDAADVVIHLANATGATSTTTTVDGITAPPQPTTTSN